VFIDKILIVKVSLSVPMEKLKVGIVGCGFVGTHLLECFLSAGISSIAFDISESRMKQLVLHIMEVAQKDWGLCTFANKVEDLSDCNVFCICVPTLLRYGDGVDHTNVNKAIDSLKPILKKGSNTGR
jgi:UDP-N-acetyl-D-glucosamine/UDP-N-acetyl-D-galactosamine dehydrogenase